MAFCKLTHNGCANKPEALLNYNKSVSSPAAAQPSAPCPQAAKKAKAASSSKQQAGLDFREYAMHGSTERMKGPQKLADVHEQEANSGRTALHKAAFWGHIETITYLLDVCKLDPNVMDFTGDTALHDAVRFGHAPLVKKLIASGADKTILNKAGTDAEALAKEYGKTEIAATLARA